MASESADVVVYVVDHEAAICDSIGMLLACEGISTRQYTSSSAFLDACLPQAPGCVLLDGHMPKRDGLGLLREFRGRGHTLPVIVMSADEELLAALAAQPDPPRLLRKPFGDSELISCIRQVLQPAT